MASLDVPEAVRGQSAADLSRSCSDYLTAHTKRLADAVQQGQRGVDVARMYSRMFDGLLNSLFCAAEASVRHEEGGFGRLSVVAVGGYGRATVAPNSDVDVLFLCEDASDPLILKVAERMLYPLWDSGVDIGHALRSVDETLELSESDIRTSTTLLDMRHVAGDPSLMTELEQQGQERIFHDALDDFIVALEQDTSARQARFGDTLFLREPELKLGRGGLRDLDVVTWIARARWGVDCLEDAVQHGALSEAEMTDVQAAREHLWLIRNHLHLTGRRRQDRLTFDEQEGVSQKLGYSDGIRLLGVEQMMQNHYRHARVIARLADCMGERARRSVRDPTTLVDLGGGLSVRDHHIGVDPAVLAAEPITALRLYQSVIRRRLPPDPAARDAILAAAVDRDWCQRLRRDPEAASLFMQLLVSVDPVRVRGESLVEEFHELGILMAMIPEMDPITGRVSHDAYHSYTADVQSLKSLDRLRALRRGELASEHRLVSRYAAEMPRTKPLHLALLLNSIGAGHPDDPAKHAAALAGPIGERLGLTAERVQHVQWLITNRNRLYHWAMRRDLSDPETIAEAADELRTVYRLRDLYLLTFCDVSSTNPQAMTAWNARMLDDLAGAVTNHFDNGPNAEQQLEYLRQAPLEGIRDADERAQLALFISQMPDRYLLANTVEGIRFHARAATGEPPAVAATPSGVGAGTLELLVTMPEQPGILEKTTAALAASSFSVDSAQVYQRNRGEGRLDAFSLFHVGHPSLGDGIDLEDEVAGLRDKLRRLLGGELTTETLIDPLLAAPSWKRQGPKVKTEVHVDNSASSRCTVVDVYTRDRVALLHVIAGVLHRSGLNVALAKINTEGNRVADVFYVEQIGGGKLSGQGQLAKLSKDLRRAITALDKK